MSSRILLVEDEPGLVLTVSDLLTAEGYEVETAGDGEAGLAKAADRQVRPGDPRRDAAAQERLRRLPRAAPARRRYRDPDADGEDARWWIASSG